MNTQRTEVEYRLMPVNETKALQLYALRRIDELTRELAFTRRYIQEMEKQLEHAAPGVLSEVRAYLEEEDRNK